MDVEIQRGGQVGREKDHTGIRAGLQNGGDGVLVNVLNSWMFHRGNQYLLM